ncbi:MAG: acetyl/propionyl/methylcrotonyl-CoA carboxylase subunit alpha [Thiomonas sp.]|uniref:acetyl/propionyl/methylcrotonyl-CoA carboxylase subunit alpha n=1 Tax=Thiomonas sp. TaxID=2047785 RepID=UPI002A35ABEA|nr:acetyl/propionyl/methylcrotonyl-CoA carboxylase subunit alpha [Thiomonas sp.]MDY0329326.1 acetyl/propionyl/methylcrotonyl-CoA carboxylase subunit alpha [Thiomonas sp.]
MFSKILIANRGEIACRVAATCRRLGIGTVAVYSEADAQAAHVAACDEAVGIGPAEAAQSYLRGERILRAARDTGAQAIHPGYGFLSENAGFARQCAEAGVVFIGPPPEAMQAMGLKAESKRLMQAAGVPLVPGYHGADQSAALLQAEAERIGFPVLIKASAGGGGKGMREVRRAEDFAAALASCRREAQSSFGNDAVLIERLVRNPRHIEIQVFADRHGHVLWLFERDCSMQRRHQKVIEEAPAPGLPEALRREMGEAAVAAARAVGYVGAGTVEFIVECSEAGTPQTFYFMEMNTRLQVEHPVTELITGLDLVAWQLRVAAGEPLPITQAEVRCSGHAIEARLYAEHPEAGFLPVTGQLRRLALPPHAAFGPVDADGIRVDGGVREGDTITPFYDPMIAKFVAWGETREQARRRLRQALAATRIAGLQTNAQFLHRLLGVAAFAQAALDTGLIAREQQALLAPPSMPQSLACAAVIGALLEDERAQQTADPWSACDGFTNGAMPPRAFRFDSPWGTLDCTLHPAAAGRPLRIQTPGLEQPQRFACSAHCARVNAATTEFALVITLGGQRAQVNVVRLGETSFQVFSGGEQAMLQRLGADLGAADAGQAGGRLTAPMPGKIIALHVQPGDTVQAGAPLLVLEAMKMEHTLSAPSAGQVSEVLCAVGDQVSEGAELLRIEALKTEGVSA